MNHQSYVTNVAFTAAGYASIGNDRHLRLWDTKGEAIAAQKVGAGGPKLVALAAQSGGECVVTGTKKLVLFNASTGKKIGERKGHGSKGMLTDIVFLSDDRTFVSGSMIELWTVDNSVMFWSTDSEESSGRVLLMSQTDHPCEVRRLVRAAGSDDLFALAYARSGGPEEKAACNVFHIPAGTQHAERIVTMDEQLQYDGFAAAPGCVIVPVFESVDKDGITRYSLRTYGWDGTLKRTLEMSSAPALAVSPDGERLAVARSYDDGIDLYSLPDLSQTARVEIERKLHFRMAFSRSGKELLYTNSEEVGLLQV